MVFFSRILWFSFSKVILDMKLLPWSIDKDVKRNEENSLLKTVNTLNIIYSIHLQVLNKFMIEVNVK